MVELDVLSRNQPAIDKEIRPPTPPRESVSNESKYGAFDRVFGTAKRLFRRTSSITTLTPQSSAEPPDTPSTSSRKRVGWADLSGGDEVPTLHVDGNQIFSSPVQPLPPSTERKPPRSILKSTSYNAPGGQIQSLHVDRISLPNAEFASMLESSTQMLAGGDRSAKVDAYLSLSRAIKSTEGLLDLRALKPKVDLILSFVKRDLEAKRDEEKPETSLALNALMLLCSFFHTPAIADLIPTDFAIYIVDTVIKSLEDLQPSKDVARHLMFILAKQTFATKVMNQERVGRVLSALHDVDSRMTGKRVMDGRINIYRTLIRQSRTHMVSNHSWLDNLFMDMASKVKETRASAITLGFEAAYSLGNEPKITKAVSALFQTELPDKGKYGQLYVDRLNQMSQSDGGIDATAPAIVPQIWSVVILFFRGRLQLLERWEYLSQWLAIISNAFNGSDVSARKEALLAWNRLVYVVHGHETTSSITSSSALAKLLPQALEGQLRRASMRSNAMNTLCCLLHYSLKPTNTSEQYDKFWRDYVVRLLWKPVTIGGESTTRKTTLSLEETCTVLRWLLDITTQRRWNEHKISENSFLVHELCPLDPKWVRRNASVVFPILEGILQQSFLDLAGDSSATDLWTAYITSIASPAAKEIKVSNDTMATLAAVYSFLYKTWRAGPQSLAGVSNGSNELTKSTAFIRAFGNTLRILIDGLGTLPFTERQLCMGVQDVFTPIATPSQKPSRLRGETGTPFQHLISLLSSLSPAVEYDGSFANLIKHVLDPFLISRKSKNNQIEFIRTVLDYLPAENTEACRVIWQVLASITTTIVDTRDNSKNPNHGQQLGTFYKDLVRILEFGITLTRNEPALRWKSLFDAIACSAMLDAGDAGKAVAVIEPLATCLLRKNSSITPLARLLHLGLLVSQAGYPKDKHTLDCAIKKIWGTLPASQKGNPFNPFPQLYDFMRHSFEVSYPAFNLPSNHVYCDVFDSTSAFLSRCPVNHYLEVLKCIQKGLGSWIQDQDSKYIDGDIVSEKISSLWRNICDHLMRLTAQDQPNLLVDLTDLFCCAFESKHAHIVTATIKFWNSVVGNLLQHEEHSEQLQEILLRLQTATKTSLPSQIQDNTSENELAQNIVHSPTTPSIKSRSFHGRLRNFSGKQQTTSEMVPSRNLAGKSASSRNREVTPPSGRQQASDRKEPPSRLRHDDSQIQFQPIDSSPVTDNMAQSQVLTNHQKEIRERQQETAGLFHDIGSSLAIEQNPVKETEQQLPPHRPSSDSPKESRERKLTPTLANVSDDEDGFVVSSPTPSRSNYGDFPGDDDASSSALFDQRIINLMSNELPASHNELEVSYTSAYPPSAQVDPLAVRHDMKTSTYGSTLDLTNVTMIDKVQVEDAQSNVQGLISDPQARAMVQPDHLESIDAIKMTEASNVAQHDVSIPDFASTQPRHPRTASTPEPHKGAHIADASSPGSSDVFEDAMTSPRWDHQRTTNLTLSSQCTDFDESSILRALAEADDHRQPEIAHGQQPTLSYQSEPMSTPQVLILQSHQSLVQVKETPITRQTRGHQPQASSAKSIILETPGADSISTRAKAGNRALAARDTIVVDGETLYDEVESTGLQKRVARKRASSSVQDEDEGKEILGGEQRLVREASSQSSTWSQGRTRGRPKKRQRTSEEFLAAVEVELEVKDVESQVSERPGEKQEPELGIQENTQTHGSQRRSLLALSGMGRTLSNSTDDVFETSKDTIDDPHILGSPALIEDAITDRAVTAVVHDIAVESTPDRIKSCLNMMIRDMETASLSKMEMNELEDMFEEAKCLLFAARLRGRKSGL